MAERLITRFSRCALGAAMVGLVLGGCASDEQLFGKYAERPCPAPRYQLLNASAAVASVGGMPWYLAVYYDFDKDVLTPRASQHLDAVVTTLRAHPELEVVVRGHTDGWGSDDYNADLARRRVKSVVGYLRAQGIEAARITSRVAAGEREPILPNSNAVNRQANRRVELLPVDRNGILTPMTYDQELQAK